MLFNSIEFLLFLPIVFIAYWFICARKLKAQNFLLLTASYVFYGWWDWRFLSLIFCSSIIDYFLALKIHSLDRTKRKPWLYISLLVNLGFLGFFKYFNFFVSEFYSIFFSENFNSDFSSLNIILPVGISFYTFQTLSYTIDVYRGKLKPTRNIISFLSFVSFFPQLVAGPIERAANLLPQFNEIRVFKEDKAVDGLRQILWGLFKKVVIADNCAIYVNEIFSNSASLSGSTLLIGAFLFAFQIYGDFSGYSDIAIGTARLFGFKLMRNFRTPYFSRDIAEFWRRWHISLSSWFKDYVYIPLGGSRVETKTKAIRNVMIVFLVSGLWHGANWTFIVWGLFNALLFLPLLLLKKNRVNHENTTENNFFPSILELSQILKTFILTSLAWIIFRSESISQSFDIFQSIFSVSLFTIPSVLPLKLIYLILGFVFVEWIQRNKEHGLELTNFANVPLRYLIYILLCVVVISFLGSSNNFIYFQF